MRRALFVSLAPLGACAPAWQGDLRRHVALQRGCPEGEVTIIGDNGHRLGRQVRLEACGDSLMYEQVNTGATWQWQDITGTGDDAAPFVETSTQRWATASMLRSGPEHTARWARVKENER